MSNDVTDDATVEETAEVKLTDLALVSVLARAMQEHQKDVITPKVDAAKSPLIKGFVEEQRSDLTVIVPGGGEVGRYRVNKTSDRFVVDDEAVFDRYAESKGEIEIVVRRRESFESAVLKAAVLGPDGKIYNSGTGEEIPGIKFVPGGTPTGTVTWTWKKLHGRNIGKEVLLAAYQSGALNELLRATPELLPGQQPGASKA
ncbi:hypothetical protein ABTY59_31840 [Streptomyces sp. NPDC096079]|uniref:hypothetical protein n=1 Tax=Streptomyces sp. NPDC096079 TaxID=3155820 RepID=UPI00332EDFA7